MGLQAVLFDFNGVIIDDEPLHRHLTTVVLDEMGVRLSRADYRRLCLGRPDREAFRETIEARGGRFADAATIDALVARKAELYRAQTADPSALLMPQLPEVIAFLANRGIRLAIVSGASRAEIDRVLLSTGLSTHFATIVSADDGLPGKPAPDGFKEALARLAAQPEASLAVEDSAPGIAAARQAGLAVLGIATALPLHLLQRRCQWAVDHYSELELERLVSHFARQSALQSGERCS